MLRPAHRQRGITLIELMIASAISLVALAAVLTAYTASARHSRLQLESAHLYQQLYGIVQLISRDLRRSGYWHFDPALVSPASNPFQQGENRLRTAAMADEPADSCVLLAYDLDGDGLVGTGQCAFGHCPDGTDDDNVEQFGFRLHDQALQARYGGGSLACDSGYWQAVNDPDVLVTRLAFHLHEDCLNLDDVDQPCAADSNRRLQQAVDIDIAAVLRRHPETSLELHRRTVVRNTRLQEAPS